MANLKDSSKFEIYDDYYTPKSAWENIKGVIPRDKIIWEACCLGAEKSKSPEYLRDIVENPDLVVSSTEMNCLTDEPDNWDMIITNIPFDRKIKVPILKRLVALDKPFIIIMNSMNTFTRYFHKIFQENLEDLQVITPSAKIHFQKLLPTGELIETKNCSFYCVYICYKMNISPEKLWIHG
jgi:hypothetical protein